MKFENWPSWWCVLLASAAINFTPTGFELLDSGQWFIIVCTPDQLLKWATLFFAIAGTVLYKKSDSLLIDFLTFYLAACIGWLVLTQIPICYLFSNI